MTAEPLLSVRDLRMHFPIKSGALRRVTGHVKAVDGVSFDLNAGETLGLVGESGCGKSTLARLMMRLIEPTSGEVRFEGRDILHLSPKQMLPVRRQMQIVFQDPYSSLNPRMSVGDIIAEPLRAHGIKGPYKAKSQELLEMVGLNADHIGRHPHEFSGGQRQRIAIARALALKPKLIICDEAVSALDVSVQAQIINLLEDLQAELGLAYVFIAHDLSVVRQISDRVAVMYLGRFAETGSSAELYDNPTHPYSAALLSAIPLPDPDLAREREQIVLTGDVPSPANPPSGCAFRTRCPRAQDACAEERPELHTFVEGDHLTACFFPVTADSPLHAQPRVIAGPEIPVGRP